MDLHDRREHTVSMYATSKDARIAKLEAENERLSEVVRELAAQNHACENGELRARVAELTEALEWYAAQAQQIRDWQAGKIASLGGVYALRDDGGERARAALTPNPPPVDSEMADD